MLTALMVLGLTHQGCRREDRKAIQPSAEFARGWQMFRESEFDAAIEAFQAAESGVPPGDPLGLSAFYGEAVTWNLRRPGTDRARARSLYQKVIERAPQSDLAAYSLLDEATMLYPASADIEPDWDALAQGYQTVIDRFPAHPAGEEALVSQQFAVLRRFDPATTAEAVTRLERFAADRPGSPFVYCALILAAAGHETLGQWQEVVNLRRRAAEVGDNVSQRLAENPSTAMVMNAVNWLTNCWAIASISEFQLGDFPTAREYYGRIVEKAPTDPLYGAALLALKRLDDKEAEIRREIASMPLGR